MIKKIRNINTKNYWDRTWEQEINEEKVRYDQILPNFLSYFEKSVRILDFGCGLGANIQQMAGMLESKEFILIDLSSYSLSYAKEKLLGEKDEHSNTFEYHQDINDIEDGSVDMIISIEVLEHISNYEETLATLWRKLKNGGVLLISVPVKGIRDRNREHVNKFTVNSFFRILTKYAGIVSIAPRTYSRRSGILATAHFLIEKKPVANPVINPKL